MIISLDCETTGLDLVHGAMPFLVTTCSDEGITQFWQWDVDPLTRKPDVPPQDVANITELIDAADLIYLQNAKFDARALLTINIDLPWEKVRDTIVMGHLLASNHKHDLTSMCVEYLCEDIEPLEISIKEVTKICRAIVKHDYPDWQIAEEGLSDMPSVKGSSKRDEDKPWKNDMWLPRALARVVQKIGVGPFIPEHWLTACSDYANGDSEHTLYLGIEMERLIRERDLWAIYQDRMKLPRIACEMECYGVTTIGDYTERTIQQYEEHIAEAECELVEIAAGFEHDLVLAKGAAINNNMREFFYEKLHLPKITSKKTGSPTLDKDAMQQYLGTTEGPAYDFIRILSEKRKHDTDLAYMEAYRRFWVPVLGKPGYYHIHPSLNPCGTDHLRWASNSPNLQNVGKQEDECSECDGDGCGLCNGTGKSRVSVRNCFGPAPGREWYTMDYASIENRIPAYESQEPKMIEVYEKSNEPPYWGSLYYLTASILYGDEFWPRSSDKDRFKKECPRLYKQAKFFNLAKQYGAGRRKGDILSKVNNSYDLVDSEFPRLAALQAYYLRQAETLGYVETIPDRSVDAKRGYPILASRTEDGRVLSTTPFNYHVSGTACQCKNRALVRCSEQLAQWRREGFDGHIALEIHDEIMFDFPRGATSEANRDRAQILKCLMQQSGEDIGIPCPVSVEYHAVSWAEGVAV